MKLKSGVQVGGKLEANWRQTWRQNSSEERKSEAMEANYLSQLKSFLLIDS